MRYEEVVGDLFDLIDQYEFDVTTHGCNCFCTMGAGIAPLMANKFGCDEFRMEGPTYMGDINKLGQIDWEVRYYSDEFEKWQKNKLNSPSLVVVNSYTQYQTGYGAVDYEAIMLCLRKINHEFKGLRVGLPRIGAGLAGGEWVRIREIIQNELKKCDVTVVIHPKDVIKSIHY